MKHRVWLSILLFVCFWTGCGLPFGETENSKGEDTLGLAPDFSYDVEEQTPNILVNQIGYLQESDKVAVLQGKNLQTTFYVYHAKDGSVAYTGTLKGVSTGNEENLDVNTKEELFLADFSNIQKPGEYYIFQPDLGYSYCFQIKEQIFDDLERAILALLEEEVDSTSQICYQTAGLLMTRELYPENRLEPERMDAICHKNIQLLLQVQDPVSGSVYGSLAKGEELEQQEKMVSKAVLDQEKQQAVSLTATAQFAGVMAMYGYHIKNTDPAFASRCQEAAKLAYQSIQNSLDNVSFDAGYFATTQLFRLTSQGIYTKAMGQYLNRKEEQNNYGEYDFTLFGDLAYLSAPYGTYLEWSDKLMKKVSNQAEEISLQGNRNTYYVSAERDPYDVDGMLKDVSVIAFMNYIITNYEYTTLQRNYLEYFLGRNPKAICLVEGFGTRSVKMQEDTGVNPGNGALFYLLLQSVK